MISTKNFNPDKEYKTAIIGLGNIGFLFDLDQKRKNTWSHVSAYKKCNRTLLVAAVEVDSKKSKMFSSFYPDVPIYNTLDELLNRHKIDIISICTPTESHHEIVCKIIEYHVKAIFCEKPFAANAYQCKDLCQQALKKGILIAINHTRRWESSYLAVSDMISKNQIGDICTAHAYYPGQIYNIGTHLYDTIRMLTGQNPKTVSGVFNNNEQVDPSISGLMIFDNFTCSIMATGKREDLVFEIDIIGTLGRIKIDNNGSNVDLFKFIDSENYSGYRELVAVPTKNSLFNDRLLDAVYNIIDFLDGNKKEVNCTAEDGYWAVSIAESFLKSAKRNGIFVSLNN